MGCSGTSLIRTKTSSYVLSNLIKLVTGTDPIVHYREVSLSSITTELEIAVGHRIFSDKNGKTTDQVPHRLSIMLLSNPTMLGQSV
jgi:hypothetical protein